jgi:hypothetical protein
MPALRMGIKGATKSRDLKLFFRVATRMKTP